MEDDWHDKVEWKEPDAFPYKNALDQHPQFDPSEFAELPEVADEPSTLHH